MTGIAACLLQGMRSRWQAYAACPRNLLMFSALPAAPAVARIASAGGNIVRRKVPLPPPAATSSTTRLEIQIPLQAKIVLFPSSVAACRMPPTALCCVPTAGKGAPAQGVPRPPRPPLRALSARPKSGSGRTRRVVVAAAATPPDPEPEPSAPPPPQPSPSLGAWALSTFQAALRACSTPRGKFAAAQDVKPAAAPCTSVRRPCMEVPPWHAGRGMQVAPRRAPHSPSIPQPPPSFPASRSRASRSARLRRHRQVRAAAW